MIHAYFCTFTVYGFWLPNDPRGSGSVYVGSKALLPYGLATKVTTRKSVAWRKCDPIIRQKAKKALKYPPVRLTGIQAMWIGRAFGTEAAKADCLVYACAILPDHVHLVVSRLRFSIEHLVGRLKSAATILLEENSLHPFQNSPRVRGRLPKMWGRGDWTIFLNSEREVCDRIDYVERNPLKDGLGRQRWSFVTPYPSRA